MRTAVTAVAMVTCLMGMKAGILTGQHMVSRVRQMRRDSLWDLVVLNDPPDGLKHDVTVHAEKRFIVAT